MKHSMARPLRFPLMPSLLLLALLWSLPGWATPIGVSIALTNVLFDYDPVAKNLSAEAAPVGGLPALPLLNNGHYTETAAGDFAVTANLPPLDQQNSGSSAPTSASTACTSSGGSKLMARSA